MKKKKNSMSTHRMICGSKIFAQHHDSHIWITSDGRHYSVSYIDKSTGRKKLYAPKVIKGINYDYLELKGGRIIRIDQVVIETYKNKAPKDSVYVINHIDGNWHNHNINNLEWIELTPDIEIQMFRRHDENREKTEWEESYERYGVSVRKDGKIKQYSKSLHIQDYRNKAHKRLKYTEDAYVSIQLILGGYNECKVDDIMYYFGFVAGNKMQFNDPVILHKNNDYMDFTPGNLEWCEKTDQRYIDYRKITHDTVRKKNHTNQLGQRVWP